MKIQRVSILTISFWLLFLSFGISQKNIKESLRHFLADSSFKNAGIGVKLIQLNNGQIIASHHENQLFTPASVMKLFSTAFALEILGPDYQAKTMFYIDGEIKDSVLHGNIWVKGGGDPSIGSRFLDKKNSAFQNFLKELKTNGIHTVLGNIIADASDFGYHGVPDDWSWVDMGNYYGAGPSGLTIMDNMMSFHFKTGDSPGEPTEIISIQPEMKDLIIHNHVMSSNKRGDNAYIYGSPFSNYRFVTGELPVNKNDFIVKGSIPDPEYQFGKELKTFLSHHHILVQGEVKTIRQHPNIEKDYASKKLIYLHRGTPLSEIIKTTNHKSNNLFAEHLICLVAYEKTGKGTTENGIKLMTEFWSKHLDQHFYFTDGSGLSRSNAVSADNLTDLLLFMSQSKNKDIFFESLPITGKTGTLKYMCKNQTCFGRVHAKSGSMKRIRSYSGYIHTISGNKYAFAIIVNNASCSSSQVRKKIEGFLNEISKQ